MWGRMADVKKPLTKQDNHMMYANAYFCLAM
jgi:hypothetical protein